MGGSADWSTGLPAAYARGMLRRVRRRFLICKGVSGPDALL